MEKKTKAIFNKLIFSGIILLLILLMQPLEVFLFIKDIPVLFPSGIIALKERNLLLLIQVIMLFFIIPIYVFTFIFSWWYRSENKKAKYDPHLVDHKVAEFIWWGLPLLLTMVVAVITWIKTHELDPYRPLPGEREPIRIEAVALQWKWLFIYPEEKIATINYIRIPEDTPIHFAITADAPMNSLWIPALSGQIYAMPGMRTELNLVANDQGIFRGSSAQISGKGFAGMTFKTEATTEEDYRKWVQSVRQTGKELDWESYQGIAAPSEDNPVALFRLTDENLFDEIIRKFTQPREKVTYVR